MTDSFAYFSFHEQNTSWMLWMTDLALRMMAPLAYAGGLVDPGIAPGDCNFVTGKITAACIPIFIGHVIQFLFGLTGAFFVINVMIAGYQIALGGATGDKEAGKRRLIHSIVGLVVCILAYIILNLMITVMTRPLTP